MTADAGATKKPSTSSASNFQTVLKDLQTRMRETAANLELEEAARLLDEIKRLGTLDLEFTKDQMEG